jgi:peptidoglycan/xylan/chitin deacetylase (PgdA/CDA1 family)
MNGTGVGVPVLTYHSISASAEPTSIDPATFRMQVDELVAQGYASLSADEFIAWHRSPGPAPGRRVLLTFDDGFGDFASAAFPILRDRGFTATVFIPTGWVGRSEQWRGAKVPARPLLDWPTIRELAVLGVEFGGHGVAHVDLTQLAPAARRAEIVDCGRVLADRIGRPTRCFAAPYGRVNAAVLADIAAHYEAAVGTRFERAQRGHPRHDLPRVEMHYFRDRGHWRRFLQGGYAYFQARKLLRWAGIAARSVARGAGG